MHRVCGERPRGAQGTWSGAPRLPHGDGWWPPRAARPPTTPPFSFPKTGSPVVDLRRGEGGWAGERGQMLSKQRKVGMFASEPRRPVLRTCRRRVRVWGWLLRAISIKSGATPAPNKGLDLFSFLAAQSSKITLAATFLATSTFLRKYKYGHYFTEMAPGNIIKRIYFILIYLKCAETELG